MTKTKARVRKECESYVLEHFLQWYLVGKYLRSKTGMFMTFLILYLYRELVFDWPVIEV